MTHPCLLKQIFFGEIRMKKRSELFFGFVIIFILACNLGLSAPATITAPSAAPITDTASAPAAIVPAAATIEAPTSVPAPTGISVSANGTSFIIPQGLANGATLSALAASLSPDAPYWDIYPAYIEFALDGYVLQNKTHSARIIIYPVSEYAKVNEGAAQIISDLQTLLANPNAQTPQNLPFLPLFNAGQVFHSNEQFIKFQNGVGIRFLTQFAQAPYPANNQDLLYTFQGITSDNAYYVAAILPINIAFLPQDGNPESPLPADGVPFDWNNFENVNAHFELVKQKLNASDPNAFTPSLTSLDALMQSVFAGNQ